MRTSTWERDYATVEQARIGAADATVLRRRSAQELHENLATRSDDTWPRRASRRIRKYVEDTREKLERLQRDPAATRPTAPTVGTPAQEIAKDARSLQTKQQLDQRPAMRQAAPRTPQVPTRGLER